MSSRRSGGSGIARPALELTTLLDISGAPTFGDDYGIGGTSPFTAGAKADTVTAGALAYIASFVVKHRVGGGAGTSLKAAIWADNAGEPGTLLGISAPAQMGPVDVAYQMNFGFNPPVVLPATIHVGLVNAGSTASADLGQVAGTGETVYDADTPAGPWHATPGLDPVWRQLRGVPP